ncbi:hypothetical protein AB7336_20920 [Providencia huaxiensis]|uniref:hypothetical protein n=1 Tax=Providencia huaxiensis TaxID=2027290 RepID=UPI0034E470DB
MNITNINAFEHSEHGVILITDAANQKAISYSEALDALDNGSFDADLLKGFELVLALSKGERERLFNPTLEQTLILCRWVVTASFVQELRDKHGVIEIDNERGGKDIATLYYGDSGSGMSIYPSGERALLIIHMEELICEQYGQEMGQQLVIKAYMDFINMQPEVGNRLSEKGRKGLTLLHDGLLKIVSPSEVGTKPVLH